MGRRRLVLNPDMTAVSGAGTDKIRPQSREPMRFHASLPGYIRTPLREAPTTAHALEVRRVLVKDESERLGLPSFKILGASWATYNALCAHLGVSTSEVASLPDLRERLKPEGTLTLVAATDGNHGRAVARMAGILGLEALILVPSATAASLIQAVEGEGATVDVVDGSYDEAVRASAAQASPTHLVISDTAWAGYERIPRWVIAGYSTLCHELEDALREEGTEFPDVVAVQVGVGGLAAAVLENFAGRGTSVVGVEPTQADAMTASLEAGHKVSVPGPQVSIMAGLNCGTPSPLAWPIVHRTITAMIAIDDDAARHAMRLLAEDGIVSGESGAAGLAGLLDRWPELPRCDADSTVLVISTEGATNPAQYETIVGRPAGEIKA